MGFENYDLNSPQSIASGEIVFVNNTFYAAAGSVNVNWQKQNNKNGIYKFSEGQWINYNSKQFAQLDSLPDMVSVAIDPRDETIWTGSYGGGLLHIKAGNSFEIFKQNSPIGQATLILVAIVYPVLHLIRKIIYGYLTMALHKIFL